MSGSPALTALLKCLYLSVMQLSVHIDLPLSNITRQVRNGVGDICQGRQGVKHANIWHNQTHNKPICITKHCLEELHRIIFCDGNVLYLC
jgi:hypothetical protein